MSGEDASKDRAGGAGEDKVIDWADHAAKSAASARARASSEAEAASAGASTGAATASAAASTPAAPSAAPTGGRDGAAGGQESAARITALETEISNLRDQLMRAAADLQNARKRADRERREAEATGGAKLARDLLAVYDNLDAALKHASEELQEKEAGFFNGVSLTRKELLNAFNRNGIQPIDPEIGAKFDPNHHQAMFEAPSPAAAPGAVMQVMQAGFMIGDRLLRPAMVGVAAAGSGADLAAALEQSDGAAGDASADGAEESGASDADGSADAGGEAVAEASMTGDAGETPPDTDTAAADGADAAETPEKATS